MAVHVTDILGEINVVECCTWQISVPPQTQCLTQTQLCRVCCKYLLAALQWSDRDRHVFACQVCLMQSLYFKTGQLMINTQRYICWMLYWLASTHTRSSVIPVNVGFKPVLSPVKAWRTKFWHTLKGMHSRRQICHVSCRPPLNLPSHAELASLTASMVAKAASRQRCAMSTSLTAFLCYAGQQRSTNSRVQVQQK